jgi:3,4-dihydroxy 2-butanone 4-phosphate synthase/GTP cyclohydrolase II
MVSSLHEIGPFLSVPAACQELRSGRMLLIYDECQAHTAMLCLAAQFATIERIQQLQHITHGAVQVLLAGNRLEALHILPEQTCTDPFHAQSTASEPQQYTARAYAETLRALVNPLTRPDDVAELVPLPYLRAHPGGILSRRGYAEALHDLLRIAGLEAGMVSGAIDMSQATEPHYTLRELAEKWQIGIISLDELVSYRKEHHVSLITETDLPTELAPFRLQYFQEIESGQPYLALLLGDVRPDPQHPQQPPLLRLHSACATGDLFGSQRCDCQAQLHSALQTIAAEGRGVLLYLPQEGRGIGLAAKLQAYQLQQQGYDTIEANEMLGYPVDARDYSCALEILRELGLLHVRLMTNNPDKITSLQQGGITVERVPLELPPTSTNLHYLQTKHQHLGHLFSILEQEPG